MKTSTQVNTSTLSDKEKTGKKAKSRKRLVQLSIFDIQGVDNEKETNNLKTLL